MVSPRPPARLGPFIAEAILNRVIAVAVTALALAAAVHGQTSTVAAPAASGMLPADAGQNPFFASTPSGQVTPGVLQLSLLDAIDRGLKYNLGLLLAGTQTDAARAARLRALSDILPKVDGTVGESVQQLNPAQFGFRIPGIPDLIGPFGLFDARASMTEKLGLHDWNNARASVETLRASEHGDRNARELVVLAVGATYLQSIAASARVDAVQAQLNTAQTLYQQAVDMKKAGVVPGIDVLRAQVEERLERQRLVAARNEFAKSKLTLGRVIGLPAAQEFALSDKLPYQPLPDLTLEQALTRAYQARSDYQAALALVRAAELSRKAAEGQRLPSLQVSADYGALGRQPAGALVTYTVAGGIRVPIFQGGKIRSDVEQADATLRQRRLQAEDLRARIEYEVRTAFLDVQAAGEQVQVAEQAAQLSGEELKQAQDRFAAGVTGNLEVVQAQQAVAVSTENYIDSLNAHNVAKLLLARALGVAETRVKEYLKGQP